jgi:hypothetical protein
MENVAVTGHGGGIFCTASSPTITRNLFIDNKATDATNGLGGGIACEKKSAPTVQNNSFSGNKARIGAGFGCDDCSLALVSNSFSANQADFLGGGFLCFNGSTVALTNCIFWGDSTTPKTAPELAVEAANVPSTLTVTYSDVQGGDSAVQVGLGCTLTWGALPGGKDILDTDPLFLGPTFHDLHLKSKGGCYTLEAESIPPTNSLGWLYFTVHSPCIDAGDPASAFGNELAPNGGRVNMGAYGNTDEASKSLPLIQVIVTKAPQSVKKGAQVRVTWNLVGLPKKAKIHSTASNGDPISSR